MLITQAYKLHCYLQSFRYVPRHRPWHLQSSFLGLHNVLACSSESCIIKVLL